MGIEDKTPLLQQRKKWIKNLLIVIFACILIYLIYWVIFERKYISTDDAYVEGNIVQISPQTTGVITDIFVTYADKVRQGQLLIKLDNTNAKIELERAKASLASSVRQTAQLFLQVDQAKSNLALQEAKLHQANLDYIHRRNLSQVKAIALEKEENAYTDLQVAQSSTELAHIHLYEALSQVDGTSVVTHPLVLQAKSNVQQAYLNLIHTELLSPVDGFVAKRSAQVGDFVGPGRDLMSIIPLSQIWVTANFKETDLEGISPGQSVNLTSDLYGHDVKYKGIVYGIVPGTGSSFSLLPAMNATGNWIKIIQRVPVIITLEKDNLEKYPLLLGLSMNATVKKTKPKTEPQQQTTEPILLTSIYSDQLELINIEISKIIQQNLGL
ncbi:MAG: efflux RND transporter periplasmic adaptor subunit [Chlamydiales bacterium]|nr:efflux RND transporter periplasmic adaptor subunit [Chlamydiales bacterium]